jgi:hypothetical protein
MNLNLKHAYYYPYPKITKPCHVKCDKWLFWCSSLASILNLRSF